jgi:hypothetical protein
MLRIRKDWTAKKPAQPDNQGANPMLPNDDCMYSGGGELVLDCQNKPHTNKPRGGKEAPKMEKILYNNQPQARDKIKDVGGLGNS